MYMEFNKILINSLKSKDTSEEFKRLDNNKKLEQLIPKVNEMKTVGECKYHVVNCFDHSINALKELEDITKDEFFFSNHLKDKVWNYLNTIVDQDITKLDILKLGLFLHDVGKPDAKTIDENGRVHFKGHEKIGGDIVIELGKSLGLSQSVIDVLFKYVRYHMFLLVFYKNNDISKEKLFEVFDLLGEDTIGAMILGYADIVSTRKLLDPNEEVGVIKTYMEFILTNYEYRYKK